MKGTTEARVAEALRRGTSVVVYKPPDDARNRKPCDFMVWRRDEDFADFGPYCLWIEVKDVAGPTFLASELRPSQRMGVALAQRAGIPYWLVVHWQRHERWTLLRLDLPDNAALWQVNLPFESDAWASAGREMTSWVTASSLIGWLMDHG